MITDYERYQLEWMIEHGYSLKDLMGEISIHQEARESNAGRHVPVDVIFDEWMDGRGFGGELFASEKEWREGRHKVFVGLS